MRRHRPDLERAALEQVHHSPIVDSMFVVQVAVPAAIVALGGALNSFRSATWPQRLAWFAGTVGAAAYVVVSVWSRRRAKWNRLQRIGVPVDDGRVQWWAWAAGIAASVFVAYLVVVLIVLLGIAFSGLMKAAGD